MRIVRDMVLWSPLGLLVIALLRVVTAGQGESFQVISHSWLPALLIVLLISALILPVRGLKQFAFAGFESSEQENDNGREDFATIKSFLLSLPHPVLPTDVLTALKREMKPVKRNAYKEGMRITKDNEPVDSESVSLRSKESGLFLAEVAHEIKNPASFASIAAYNLRRDLEKFKSFLFELAGDEGNDEVLAAFNERFNVLFKHTDTITDGLSRIKEISLNLKTTSDLNKRERKPEKLLKSLESTLEMMTSFRKSVEIKTDLQADPAVKCNLDEIRQVFMNLSVNACQAIVEKQKKQGGLKRGVFCIETREENNHAVIRFRDTGLGIREETRNRIFEPFFTTKPKSKGEGLGLFISNRIIQKHGGRLEVESTEGKGSTFTVFLPMTRGETLNN